MLTIIAVINCLSFHLECSFLEWKGHILFCTQRCQCGGGGGGAERGVGDAYTATLSLKDVNTQIKMIRVYF